MDLIFLSKFCIVIAPCKDFEWPVRMCGRILELCRLVLVFAGGYSGRYILPRFGSYMQIP